VCEPRHAKKRDLTAKRVGRFRPTYSKLSVISVVVSTKFDRTCFSFSPATK